MAVNGVALKPRRGDRAGDHLQGLVEAVGDVDVDIAVAQMLGMHAIDEITCRIDIDSLQQDVDAGAGSSIFLAFDPVSSSRRVAAHGGGLRRRVGHCKDEQDEPARPRPGAAP